MNKRGYLLLAIAGIAALLFAVGFHVTHRNGSEAGPAMHAAGVADGMHAQDQAEWICPMHPQVRQDHPGRCPICGMDLVAATDDPSAAGHAHDDALSVHHHHDEPAPAANAVDAADAWICPMHPQIRQDHPGRCPICGMDLVHHEGGGAPRHETGIPVSGELQQRLGVRLAAVERRQLSREVRSWGTVVPNESALFEVSPKIDGWLRKLHVSAVGETVHAGQALYELYSPDLVQRQREFIELLRRGDQLREAVGMPTGQNAQMLASLARERLRNRRLFENADLDKAFIDRLEQYRRPVDVVVVRAVRSGVVTRIGAREGSYITPQTSLLSLANLSQGWVDIAVYPDQRAWVAAGDAVTVTSQDAPHRQISGRLQLPNPLIDRGSRTLRARLVFDNSDGQLLPGTDVDVRIATASRSALAVPRSALIRTGAGDRVMLADDDGHFAATPVQIGIADDDYVEIVSGLDEGQRVAVSGQFLLDAAASLQLASRSAQDTL
jgi:Cu(I)/Ag(I) efflux system membrane fusion protein